MIVLLLVLLVGIVGALALTALCAGDEPTSDELDPSVRARYESRRANREGRAL